MAKAFVEGLFDDGEYRRQKEQIEFELASLVVPEADITEEAGKLLLVLRLPALSHIAVGIGGWYSMVQPITATVSIRARAAA